MVPDYKPDLFKILLEKGNLKRLVYQNTFQAFQSLKKAIIGLEAEYHSLYHKDPKAIPFVHQERGDLEVHLQFAGDVLVFVMHTNVFEFSRYHEVMKTNYIREDKSRSYCGIINIYNFLADSFRYNRGNDIGYLIGRIFVNKDNCYFIEGKREVGLLYNNFGKAVLDEQAVRDILESAILYTINFDLLTPPYDSQKEVSLDEIRSLIDSRTLKTGKRLGFRFQADEVEDEQ
jgi:hypothetical protein